MAYEVTGPIWTIGYGHTSGVSPGETITEEQARALLRQDLQVVERQVSGAVRVPISQNQADALIDFTFNLGLTHLMESDVLRLVNAGQFDQAADAFLSWDHIGRAENYGLLRRRKAERALFLTPDANAVPAAHPDTGASAVAAISTLIDDAPPAPQVSRSQRKSPYAK